MIFVNSNNPSYGLTSFKHCCTIDHLECSIWAVRILDNPITFPFESTLLMCHSFAGAPFPAPHHPERAWSPGVSWISLPCKPYFLLLSICTLHPRNGNYLWFPSTHSMLLQAPSLFLMHPLSPNYFPHPSFLKCIYWCFLEREREIETLICSTYLWIYCCFLFVLWLGIEP